MKATFLLAILVTISMMFGTQAFAATASEDLAGVIADTAYFDGGPGSTLNE